MDSATMTAPLKIEVGARYVRRDGSITPALQKGEFPQWAKDPETGWDYDINQPDGNKVWGDGENHEHDLISLHRSSLKN